MDYQLNKKDTITITLDEADLTTLWLALELKKQKDLDEYKSVFANTNKMFNLIDEAGDELNKVIHAK